VQVGRVEGGVEPAEEAAGPVRERRLAATGEKRGVNTGLLEEPLGELAHHAVPRPRPPSARWRRRGRRRQPCRLCPGGARFFLGIDNHYEISLLLFAAGRRQPLQLVGGAGTAPEILARRVHRMASRPAGGFLVVDKEISGYDIRIFMNRHRDITAFVDLRSKPDELDLVSIRELAMVNGAAIQFVFAAPTASYIERWLPGVMVAHRIKGARTDFEVAKLRQRCEDRRVLAELVLEAHAMKAKIRTFDPQELARVLHHPATRTLGDLWHAPLRLAALAQTDGSVTPALDLLSKWGCDEKRMTLDDWVYRLEIDMTKMCRSAA